MRKAASTISLAMAFSVVAAFLVSRQVAKTQRTQRMPQSWLIPSAARTDDFGIRPKHPKEATDGNLREALCTLPGFCISLFRPHRHSGIPAAPDPSRAHRSLLP